MKALQLFTHRPPTSGIHLLSDPFPERLNGSTNLFTRAEALSTQRIHFSPPLRSLVQTTTTKK
jgi:hypothetical protein